LSVAEQHTDRALRRLDWRWLLGTPYPPSSVVFGAQTMLTEGLQQISERVVAANGAVPDEAFDLAVVINPRRAVLDRAWRSLRPGGACYSAWYSPFSGGPRGVSRRLRAARFDMLGCYMPWPVPPFRTPRVWLPVDQPGAVNYFLSSRPRTRSPTRDLSRRLLRQLWRASLKLGFGLPICALACKPPVGHTPRSEPLLEWVRQNWSSWQLGPTPERLSSLLLTGGPRTSSKVVALVFGEPEARPRVALKMARTPEAAASLRAEATALEALRQRRPDMNGVPRLVFWRADDRVHMQGQEARLGTPIFARLTPGTYRGLAVQVTDWLIQLAGQPRRRPREAWWDRLVEPVLADFRNCFGPVVDHELLARTRAGISRIDSLPIVFEQGDLWTGNVLVQEDGQLAVLDWESADPEGLPARDLLYFLADLVFFYDNAFGSRQFGASYRASLDPTTPTGAVWAECLERYAGALQLTPHELQGLRLLAWMAHACWDFHLLASRLSRTPDPTTARTIRFVELWLEEARRWST
jgi:hypothetical protein